MYEFYIIGEKHLDLLQDGVGVYAWNFSLGQTDNRLDKEAFNLITNKRFVMRID